MAKKIDAGMSKLVDGLIFMMMVYCSECSV